MTVECQAFFTRVQVRLLPLASLALASKNVQYGAMPKINDVANCLADERESSVLLLQISFWPYKNFS